MYASIPQILEQRSLLFCNPESSLLLCGSYFPDQDSCDDNMKLYEVVFFNNTIYHFTLRRFFVRMIFLSPDKVVSHVKDPGTTTS